MHQLPLAPLFIYLLASIFSLTIHAKESMDTSLIYKIVSDMPEKNIVEIADSAYSAGDYSNAISLYIATFGRDDNSSLFAHDKIRAYLGAGLILAHKCNYAGALDYFIKGLKLSESTEGNPLAAKFYKNIGNIFSSVGDYEQGQRYYLRGLNECAVHPDMKEERKLLINLAVISTYIDKPEQCREYIMKAKRLPLEIDDETIYMEKQMEGIIMERTGNHRKAIEIFKNLGDFARKKFIEPRYSCSTLQHLYFNYDKLNISDSAFFYLKECEKETEKNGIIYMFPVMLQQLSIHYKKAGMMEKSQEYKMRYLDIRDSLSNEREFNSVKNIQFQYEASKVADKIGNLKRQRDMDKQIIKKQHTMLWWIVSITCSLLFFLFIFYWQKRKLRQSYRSLYEINREFTQKYEAITDRVRKDSELILSKDHEIARLNILLSRQHGNLSSSTHDDSKAEPPIQETDDNGNEIKYSKSNLNDRLRRKLTDTIIEVMERDNAFCNPDFSLDHLARLVGSNPKYVSQTINEEFNKNFSSYVNEYRVRLAKERLCDKGYSNLTVKAIGESVGFKSQSAFTNVFRTNTGLTPSMFQKLSRTK